MNCDLNVLTIIFKEIENYLIQFFLNSNRIEMNDFERHQWYIDNVLSTKLEKPTELRYFYTILYKVKTQQDIDYSCHCINVYPARHPLFDIFKNPPEFGYGCPICKLKQKVCSAVDSVSRSGYTRTHTCYSIHQLCRTSDPPSQGY
ncbi:hypothetical protein DDB_G0289297 [Dictyostelium discoideum AX4]|uniref:Uncharacterized protein n=1 Tax=Dictyostelium discoideum TaxID=44689 RepID=Q54HQ1_DICDI|nr:hypothetical protein DDB_G0289297 [Dictyostelium discoideum AX4]EAL62795.1 hypothetical protein DDB_G0289297 [Dictyostelium discoideum AX4]|eukprot:XP_636310.1 hypothetical protein DDB_G0289297 [Dictyostelium discoideum AX4]